MAPFCLLAVVIFKLVPRLQSTRINSGIARTVRSSQHSRGTDTTVVPHDEKLLVCRYEQELDARIIIPAKDKPIVDYILALRDASLNCEPFTPPQKPSSMIKNLATHSLPEDIIGLIGSFDRDMHCNWCTLYGFDMTFLEKCSAALNQDIDEQSRVNFEVDELGGSCAPKSLKCSQWERQQTLQTCMASPEANQVAICRMNSESFHSQMIKIGVNKIGNNERQIQSRRELIEKKVQEHKKFLEDSREFIKEREQSIKVLQDNVEVYEQNAVYLAQMTNVGM